MKRAYLVLSALACCGLAQVAASEPSFEAAKTDSGSRFLESGGAGAIPSQEVPVVVDANGSADPRQTPLSCPVDPASKKDEAAVPPPYAPYRDAAEAAWAQRLYSTLKKGVITGAAVGGVAGIAAGASIGMGGLGGVATVLGLGVVGAAGGVIVGGVAALFVLRHYLRERGPMLS